MRESILAVRPELLPKERWSEYDMRELVKLLEQDDKALVLQDAEMRAENNGFLIVPGECLSFLRKISLRLIYKENAYFDIWVGGKRERYYVVAKGELRHAETVVYDAYVKRIANMKGRMK